MATHEIADEEEAHPLQSDTVPDPRAVPRKHCRRVCAAWALGPVVTLCIYAATWKYHGTSADVDSLVSDAFYMTRGSHWCTGQQSSQQPAGAVATLHDCQFPCYDQWDCKFACFDTGTKDKPGTKCQYFTKCGEIKRSELMGLTYRGSCYIKVGSKPPPTTTTTRTTMTTTTSTLHAAVDRSGEPAGYFYYLEGRNCPASGVIMSPEECKAAADDLGIFFQWKSGSATGAKMSATHVPPGCWTRVAADGCWSRSSCELSINTNTGASNNGGYASLCKNENAQWPSYELADGKYPPGYFFILEGRGGDCPDDGVIATANECKAAAVSLGKWNRWRGGDPSKARIKQGFVPSGCWTRAANNNCWKSGSCELSINTATVPGRRGTNNGNYAVLCKNPNGAFNGDAVAWPNIRYATMGYNLYEGDPLPVLNPNTYLAPGINILDPGLKKPLFAIEYSQGRITSDWRHTNPDGYHATVDQGCSTIFTTKTIRDEYQYKTDQSKKVSMYARVEAAVKFPPPPGKGKGPASKVTVGVSGKAFARAGGTLSHQWRDIQQQNNLMDQEMYRTDAKCSSYVAAYSYVQPPPTHPEFKKRVKELGSADSYFKLFDDFGTHFLTSVRMGARYGSSMFVDKSKSSDMQKTANGLGATVDVSVGAVAKLGVSYKSASVGVKKVKKLEAKIPLLTPKEKLAGETFKARFIKKSTQAVVGPPMPVEGVAAWSYEVDQAPVPIQWDDEVICLHPEIVNNDANYRKCVEHMDNYCEQHLKKRGASCAAASEKECYSDLDCEPAGEFVCRDWKCAAVPKCVVTVYTEQYKGGRSFRVPAVTSAKYLDGMVMDLKNGDFADTLSSFDMSSGCQRVELADDDGNCCFGKKSNGRFTSSQNTLRKDLNNDACKVKVWAKPVPEATPSTKHHGWIDLSGETVRASQCQDRFAHTAPRAIDGITDTNWQWHSCTETTWADRPWWKVDLGRKYAISAVRVTNRGDCCGDRLNGFEIWTNQGRCASNLWLGNGDTQEFACSGTSEMVKIQLPRYGYLTLCEVAVKGRLLCDESITYRGADYRGCQRKTRSGRTCQSWNQQSPQRHSFTNMDEDENFCRNPDKENTIWCYTTDPRKRWEFCDPVQGRRLTGAANGTVETSEAADHLTSLKHSTENMQKMQDTKATEAGVMQNVQTELQDGRFLESSHNDHGSLSPGSEEGGIAMERNLGAASGEYLKNIGKAMYGYNHYFGAPSSSEHAGTDPGFMHRPLWKASYTKGSRASFQSFSQVPKDTHGYIHFIAGKKNAKVGNPYDGFNQQVPGYTRKKFNLEDAKAECLKVLECSRVQCDKNNENCQLCTSKGGTYYTTDGEIIYNKRKYPKGENRRLSVEQGENTRDVTSVYGPDRGLGRSLYGETSVKAPDGWRVIMAKNTVCDNDFQTRKITSQYDYEREESWSLNPMGFKLDVGEYTFSMSSESTEFRKSNSKYKKKMYKTTAECFEYQAEIPDLANNPPPTSDTFKFVVDAATEETDFYAVFDMFGLKFPVTMMFGAKYGFTQMIEESNYATLASQSSSFSVGAEVTKGIKLKKGISPQLGLSATAGVSYGEKNSQSETEKFDSHFSEIKEFSLGRRMPNEGGAKEWVKQIDGEPMPTRYAFKSICEHPAFITKKDSCETFIKTYCDKHLALLHEGVVCNPAEKPECTWDMDCPDHHRCTNQNTCEELPSCTLHLYSSSYYGGTKRTFGPVYYTDAAGGKDGGKVFDTVNKAETDSARVSQGCEQVILMDNDQGCRESRADNLILGRRTNQFEVGNFNKDLQSDICMVKLLAKRTWDD